MEKGIIAVAVAACATCAAPGLAGPLPQFEVTPLENPGPVPGDFGGLRLADVNAAGRTVGSVGERSMAYTWSSDGTALLLPALTDDLINPFASAINDAGAIGGFAGDPDNGGFGVWRPDGDGYDLTLLPRDAGSTRFNSTSGVTGLNDLGQATGTGTLNVDGRFGGIGSFRWTPGDEQLTRLLDETGEPGRSTFTNDINNAGAIVGSTRGGAAVWEAGRVVATLLTGPAFDRFVLAGQLDDRGNIAGAFELEAGDPGGPRDDFSPAFWDADRDYVDLVGPGGEVGVDLLGEARAVAEGVAVGFVGPTSSGDPERLRAVAWLDPLGGEAAVYLDDLLADDADGWSILRADALAIGTSDGREVVRVAGVGVNPDFDGGVPTPVLLTGFGDAVPEPAGAAGVLAGGALFLRRRHRG